MYNQKYAATTKNAVGSNNNSQPRTNGTTASVSGSTTNQYLHNRQQSQNGGGGGGQPLTSSSVPGPMRSPPPAELQRRESLVKPTWANISPGQVPSTTFDELVNSAKNNGAGAQPHLDGYGGNGGGLNGGAVAEGDTQSELGMLSSKLLAKNGLNQRQKKREVELYDLFGKVCTQCERGGPLE